MPSKKQARKARWRRKKRYLAWRKRLMNERSASIDAELREAGQRINALFQRERLGRA